MLIKSSFFCRPTCTCFEISEFFRPCLTMIFWRLIGLAINREFLDRIQTLRQSFTTEVRIRIIWWPTSAPRSSRHTTPTPQYISKYRVVSRREKSSVSTPQPRYFFSRCDTTGITSVTCDLCKFQREILTIQFERHKDLPSVQTQP